MNPIDRKVLVIVAKAPSPYRIHQHRRIVREMGGEVELYSVFLNEHNWQPWATPIPAEIQPVVLEAGKGNDKQTPLSRWRAERRKAKQLTAWLDGRRVDAVITAGYNSLALNRLIGWCRKRGVPNFLFSDSNIHGDRATGLRRWLKRRYVRWAVRSVTGLMPCGELGRQYYDAYGSRDKPIFYMPHEPDYARLFNAGDSQQSAVRSKYGLRDGRRYFMFSGRLVPVKRVDTLIDAYARLAQERPQWDLLIVGGGALEAELRARVPAVLADRVVWTGFVGDADELAALYQCGDAFILPSDYEPWAVVVCEAAACGMPIAATSVVGAAGELVRNGVNGQTFVAGDVVGLADILLDISQSETRLRELGEGSLRVLDDWRRRGDPVQGVRLALAHVGLLPAPPPIVPDPPTPVGASADAAEPPASPSVQ